jgi:hypothetical protein
VLEYVGPNADGTHGFHLLSGMLDAPTEKTRTFYDHLLVEDVDADADAGASASSSIPVEALFDDLPLAGLVFPLTRYTRARWDAQPADVRRHLLLADVRELAVHGAATAVSLFTWGSMNCDITLAPGRQYRLSPRYIDFNLSKILSTLLELDLRCEGGRLAGDAPETPAFVSLISDPRAFATGDEDWMRAAALAVNMESTLQATFRELHQLGAEPAGALLLKPSQRKAARRILSHRLAVVWGPPGRPFVLPLKFIADLRTGTGKTHTITSTLLRLVQINASQNPGRPLIIFLTAVTHAAIQACLSKLAKLVAAHRALVGLPVAWLDSLSIEHIEQGSSHALPPVGGRRSHIYAGTVYQVGGHLFQRQQKLTFALPRAALQL